MTHLSYYFISLLFFSALNSQNYIWPTDASKVLTSSYAESRSDRFHTGIDITTWNKEGYKCYAISDGYVYRIVTGVYGYGRAIYIKLNDGKIAVYAHTQKFRDDINDYVRSIQQKNTRYKQDIYLKPDQFLIKKGDIVAYTGSTGIGVPHLHFEIRSSMNETLNPLLFYPDFKDKNYPHISSLMVASQDTNSSISNYSTKQFFPTQISKNKYILDTIRAYGNIGFSIDVSDPTIPERKIATGVHKLELFINDSLHFKSQFDTLLFSRNNYFNLDRDNYSKKYFETRAQNLYVKQGNILKYVAKNNGVIRIDSVLNYKILVYDFKNNVSELNGVIFPEYSKPDTIPTNVPFLKSQPKMLHDVLFNDSNNTSSNLSYWFKDSINYYMGEFLSYVMKKDGLFKNTKVLEMSLDSVLFPKMDYKSKIVYLLPMQLEFKKPLKVILNDNLPKNVGVFRWNRRKTRWDFEQTERDNQGKLFFYDGSVKIHTLIRDTVKPIIRFTKWIPESDHYKIYVNDDVSGIDSEKNFELFSGDKQIVGEYDFEDKLIKIDKRDISAGKYLKVTLRDNLGNVLSRQIYISEHY